MATATTVEISRGDLSKLTTPDSAHITEVTHLASYNWLEAPTPTIAVPGSPPLWSAIKTQNRVKKDTGHVYIAQNAARHPTSPLEPLFRALFIENPDFDISKSHLVSDRNNIRKLLSFVDPTTSRNGLEAFTIKAEAVGETVIFCREETKVEEVIGPAEFKGYGHEFGKAYTSHEVNGSTGHHRIVSFQFGGMGLIIRHETDGYIGGGGEEDGVASKDDLLDKLEKLSLNTGTAGPEGPVADSKLTIRKTGRPVTRASTLEIKTRVAHKPIPFEEVASQLWISQTPNLVRAYHVRGLFNVPMVEDMTAALGNWEKAKQKALVLLVALIKKVLGVVREYGQVVIRYREDVGRLIITPKKTSKMLPDDLYLMWEEEKGVSDDKADAADHEGDGSD
ncbi:hypothetical protein MBLNU230_g0468t1 [Neophaeotheca triangularis]